MTPKAFYVSPFSELDLKFDFQLREPNEGLRIGVDCLDAGVDKVLVSLMTGQRQELSDVQLLRCAVTYLR